MNVFKYRGGSFERDLQSISEDYFWAPSRHDLNDPFEGLFDDSFLNFQLDAILKILGNKKAEDTRQESFKKSLRDLLAYVDICGIYSLSKTPLEELLWAHYGDSHKGFCLGYDLDKLIEFDLDDYRYFDVTYSNRPQSIDFSTVYGEEPSQILRVMLGMKSKAWEYEKEVRIVPSRSGKHHYDYRALKSVYFGARMPENQKLLMMEKLQGRGISYFNVFLKAGSYRLQTEKVDDRYHGVKKYLDCLAEVDDYAIPNLSIDDQYKAYEEYLNKAAEIVRREPYCNKIELVEFSSSQGSPENPVIFVQYKMNGEKWKNHYLTIPEIDDQYIKLES